MIVQHSNTTVDKCSGTTSPTTPTMTKISWFLFLILFGITPSSFSLQSSLPLSSTLSSSSYSLFTLPLKYFSLSSTQELWTSDCHPYYLSYESCLLLLQHSPSCQAAYFVHKVCHLLHLNSTPSDLFPFDSNPNHINPDEIYGVYITKFPSPAIPFPSQLPRHSSPDVLQSSPPIPPAIDSYRHCIHSNPSGYAPPLDPTDLPRLNIVISASTSWKSKNVDEFTKAISHWKCYARIHGYNFTLNMIPSKNPADFFVSR
jgi:hypothetical protein